MEEQKLTPMQMAARELSEHSTLSRADIERALTATLSLLRQRAEEQLFVDDFSEQAMNACRQYQAVSEFILFFGEQLLAFERVRQQDGPSRN